MIARIRNEMRRLTIPRPIVGLVGIAGVAAVVEIEVLVDESTKVRLRPVVVHAECVGTPDRVGLAAVNAAAREFQLQRRLES